MCSQWNAISKIQKAKKFYETNDLFFSIKIVRMKSGENLYTKRFKISIS